MLSPVLRIDLTADGDGWVQLANSTFDERNQTSSGLPGSKTKEATGKNTLPAHKIKKAPVKGGATKVKKGMPTKPERLLSPTETRNPSAVLKNLASPQSLKSTVSYQSIATSKATDAQSSRLSNLARGTPGDQTRTKQPAAPSVCQKCKEIASQLKSIQTEYKSEKISSAQKIAQYRGEYTRMRELYESKCKDISKLQMAHQEREDDLKKKIEGLGTIISQHEEKV
jgi:hypothetical protein